MIAPSRALARACQLVDFTLLDRRAVGLGERDQLILALDRSGLRDAARGRKAAEELTTGPFRLELLLADLCDATLFEARNGLPVLRPGLLPRQLIRIVDPDAVMCFCRFLEPSLDDGFDWPAVPLCDGGPITGLLRGGSTETHIHLGGSLPPVFYWLCVMSGQIGLEALAGIRSDLRGHAEVGCWQEAVVEAMTTRLRLARTLQAAVERRAGRRLFRHLPPSDALEWRSFEAACTCEHAAKCDAVLAVGEIGGGNAAQAGDDALRDPLRPRGGIVHRSHYAVGERRLLCFAAAALRRDAFLLSDEVRRELETSLLRYLRVRNAFHGALAYGGGELGLLHFVESFGRRGFVYRGQGARHRVRSRRHRRLLLELERRRMSASLDAQLVEPFTASDPERDVSGKRRIEMRVSLPRRWVVHTVRAWLLGILDHLRGLAPEAKNARAGVGLLVHLLKRRADGEGTRQAEETVDCLWWLLVEHPELRRVIVGLDAAGSERTAPPRVFAPAYRELQRRVNSHRFGHSDPIRLGYTYHVGEDADDQLTALRHLDEVVSLLLPQDEGGRLGHALALAEAPETFYARRGGGTEPSLGTHLLDLVWAQGRLSSCGRLHEHAWLPGTILRIAGVAALPAVRDEPVRTVVTFDTIAACYRRMSLELGHDAETASEEDLLSTLRFTGAASAPVSRVADPDWLKLVTAMQELLRRDFSRRRLTIEANPTSNLLIGGFSSYRELPYKALIDAGLPLSLNTDDPGLFMTSLPAEYAAMYAALEGSCPHREILAWLAERGFDADRSSFLGSPLELAIGGFLESALDRFIAGEAGPPPRGRCGPEPAA